MESFEEFFARIEEYNPHADKELIKKAWDTAKSAHEGQKRKSGEDFFIHPLEVTKVLIRLKADSATICAALLHDAVEDSTLTLSRLKEEFGDEIAEIVEGLTKTEGVFQTREEYSAENLRKILLATAKDVRVILIKLADRLHNMQTLKYFREEKQKRISKETLNIYAPIAHKLGIHFMKGELEDLAFKYLQPEAYQEISSKIAEKRVEREKSTQEYIALIDENLRKSGIEAEINGRAKYFYSIYQKMQKKNKYLSEIHDLIAIRIIPKTIPECYAALGIIHDLFKPIPTKFKDYISVPKGNGYQSLHTSVIAPHGKIIEIQIRTPDMHLIAEEGIAAHWRYKGTERDKRFDRKIDWLKQILDWKQTSETAKEFVDTLKVDLFENEIVVFTPTGDPISLPEGSTPVDFAYEIHSNIGNNCFQAIVNGSSVPLDYRLSSGEIVEIITRKTAMPSRHWLSFVKTAKARNRIRATLNIKAEHTEKGEREEQEESLLDKLIVDSKHPAKLSKCCSPTTDDEIVGFVTKDKKVTVHTKECPNIHSLEERKEVDVSWKEEGHKPLLKARITVRDRIGVLAEILQIISSFEVNVHSVYTRTKKTNVNITFKMETSASTRVDDMFETIKEIDGVLDVKVSGPNS